MRIKYSINIDDPKRGLSLKAMEKIIKVVRKDMKTHGEISIYDAESEQPEVSHG